MIQHHNPNPEQFSTSIHMILDSKLFKKKNQQLFL